MVMWIHGWKALTLGYHTATFGGFRHSGNRDKIFLGLLCDLKGPRV